MSIEEAATIEEALEESQYLDDLDSKEEAEELEQQEYAGESEPVDVHVEQIDEKIEVKEKDYEFRWLKNFGSLFNNNRINELLGNQKYLINVLDMHVDTVEDFALEDFAREVYPNIQPIKSALDRDIVLKMLLQGNPDYLQQAAYNLVLGWLDSYEHIGIIYRKQTDEMVGLYKVRRGNRLFCDVIIQLRGEYKQRAKTAKEMVVYFGHPEKGYARLIAEQGYKYALATTLNEKHAALVQSVANKECKIILKKLQSENPDTPVEELKLKAKKLIPGFKNTGTVVPRQLEGKIAWEANWRYDLGAKFNELVQQR